ncbi:MAG: T9SS type A sorting domain-containing protein, partial [Putridiphycobacter sp.]|nr:T9SS type A sorting domain-containing protein [Putridiphycobacter sp.]
INNDTTVVAWEFMDSLGNILIVEQIVYINPFFSQIERNGSVISAIESGLSYQWLDCNNNYSEIPNETNQSLIIPSNGAYCVVVSDGICSDTSECIEIGDLGMATNNTELNLELYPNPTTNLLTIQHLDASILYDIVLTDMSGKVLQSFAISNASSYELSINFERGMYLLIVTTASNQSTYKIHKK